MNETTKPIVNTIENRKCRTTQVIPWATNPNVFIEIRQYKSYYSGCGWGHPIITMPEVAIEDLDGIEQFQAALKLTKKIYGQMADGSYN